MGSGEWVVGSGEAEIWRLPNGGLNKPRDCPQLPAPNYRPGIQPQNTPNTRNESLLLSVVSVVSVV